MAEDLLSSRPYGDRDQAAFLTAMNRLTAHHVAGCAEYRTLFGDVGPATSIEDLPFVHVDLFKQIKFETTVGDAQRGRMLRSSGTSGSSSMISLDSSSSKLQAQSSKAILEDFIGAGDNRPLLVLDSIHSLRSYGELSARAAAAMSLMPLAGKIVFLLEEASNANSMKWARLAQVLRAHDDLIVYGFTWILWTAWGNHEKPNSIREQLCGKRIHFVHSGGWKKMEASRVGRRRFDSALLKGLDATSRVIDYYGLVEQMGVVYPLCEEGYRHVPMWADVIVRDPHTLASLVDVDGQLHLLNTLALGAPYHSVLTEDLGRIVSGACRCGRSGRRFLLHGRLPNAESRGCANV